MFASFSISAGLTEKGFFGVPDLSISIVQLQILGLSYGQISDAIITRP